jgi:predicted nucleotidyltransferase
MEKFKQYLGHRIFRVLSGVAEEMQVMAYVVGGFVRDSFLNRSGTRDIDVAIVGSGIDFAAEVASRIKPSPDVKVFTNFGTAMIQYKEWKLEFVGARKESYRMNSRKPLVEDGSLEDDQKRRDFTINAMAFDLRKKHFGELIDPFFRRSPADDEGYKVCRSAWFLNRIRLLCSNNKKCRKDLHRFDGKDSQRIEPDYSY